MQQFQNKAPQTKKEHYQLTGNAAVRLSQNMEKLVSTINMYCFGNPLINGTPLRSIVPSAEIPEDTKTQILKLGDLGEDLYQKFVN